MAPPDKQLQRPNDPVLDASSSITQSPEASTLNLDVNPNKPNGLRSRTKSDVGSPQSSTDTNLSVSPLNRSLKRCISQAVMAIHGNGTANGSSEEVPPVPIQRKSGDWDVYSVRCSLLVLSSCIY
jgi:hypothetical protein